MKVNFKKITKIVSGFIIFCIVFLGGLCLYHYFSIINLKEKKVWNDEIPYFDVTLETSFRADAFLSNDGEILFQLRISNLNAENDFRKIDMNSYIIIELSDKDGFMIFEEKFSFTSFTKLLDETEMKEPMGFSLKGKLKGNGLISFIRASTYREFSELNVKWAISFLE